MEQLIRNIISKLSNRNYRFITRLLALVKMKLTVEQYIMIIIIYKKRYKMYTMDKINKLISDCCENMINMIIESLIEKIIKHTSTTQTYTFAKIKTRIDEYCKKYHNLFTKNNQAYIYFEIINRTSKIFTTIYIYTKYSHYTQPRARFDEIIHYIVRDDIAYIYTLSIIKKYINLNMNYFIEEFIYNFINYACFNIFIKDKSMQTIKRLFKYLHKNGFFDITFEEYNFSSTTRCIITTRPMERFNAIMMKENYEYNDVQLNVIKKYLMYENNWSEIRKTWIQTVIRCAI